MVIVFVDWLNRRAELKDWAQNLSLKSANESGQNWTDQFSDSPTMASGLTSFRFCKQIFPILVRSGPRFLKCFRFWTNRFPSLDPWSTSFYSTQGITLISAELSTTPNSVLILNWKYWICLNNIKIRLIQVGYFKIQSYWLMKPEIWHYFVNHPFLI